ncbi:MAG: alpha-L-fucosidase [Planctomycetota bacterium]|jgi:alpha-L-fucosidase|nr:alpha-L-fucosidase [Planctomycetota bacterium]
MKPCPRYLKDFADLWATDPHAANLAWWQQAQYGMFLHYGLYSQLGRHEWVMLREAIPVAEYEKLFNSFDPKNFDADRITDLALEAGMSYINLTTCHHEGFCLWDSTVEPYNAKQACGRDLVRELGEACDAKGLGFFCYFTHVLNWRHPYAALREDISMARPDYPNGDPRYVLTERSQFSEFWTWAHACMAEICDFDFPIAGVWLDIIKMYYECPDLIPIEDTYRLIRERRPEALISFKQGATGTEDYASPEFHFHSQGEMFRNAGMHEAAVRADRAWDANKNKHNEICLTLQDNGWGWMKDVGHKSAEDLWNCLAYAQAHNCALLANTGPLPDGSLHSDDVATLKAVGKRLREQGWPEPNPHYTPQRKTSAGAA